MIDMKKTLITLALSTASLAAVADVTLYGSVKGGVEYNKADRSDKATSVISDWGSYIGFKGEEDLGSGLKAIWQIEQSVSLGGGSNAGHWATRDSFIGLAGSFGTLRAGYLSDTFKSMGKLDPWTGNGIRTLESFSRYGSRYTGVRYDSPNWSGLSLNVLYSPKDNQSSDGKDALSKDVLAVGLGYENYGWFFNYGYKNVRGAANAIGRDGRLNGEVHGLDIGYDNGTLFAGLGYRDSRNLNSKDSASLKDSLESVGISCDALCSNWGSSQGAITFAYNLGNIVPRISYAYGEEKERHVKDPSKNKYSQAIVGVDYNLSKRTAVLASLGYWSNKPKSWVEIRDQVTDVARDEDSKKYKRDEERQESYSFGLGLRHKF
ncbi:MAG: porin [Neisseriaceae bacterium]|nr:MAG: porin [Neisseriaceae bacterium]